MWLTILIVVCFTVCFFIVIKDRAENYKIVFLEEQVQEQDIKKAGGFYYLDENEKLVEKNSS